ncbi:MAG: helix-turn-helix domain-containing protein [Bdellovibrionota bacterium]|nr:helix-turn-helix domain-containing protein [Bdellovibrionota bacterium]
MPLSWSDLASMIGTAQETAIRLLSKFKEEGLIEQEKRKIYVKNVDPMRNMTR